MFALAGNGSVYAQDDASDDAVQIVKKQPRKADLPKYEMKEVSGVVLDAATKKPLSGVRVEALADARFSSMTEEDGRYKFKVPVFTTALYISTPDYNPLQLSVKEGFQTVNMYSSVFNSFYKNGNDIFTNKSVNIHESSYLSADAEISNMLEGNVRTIDRGGLPAIGTNMMINGIHSILLHSR